MSKIVNEQPAPVEKQMQLILQEIVRTQNELKSTRVVLSHYKFKSEKLTQLKRAKKELIDQINDEKKMIEDEFLEDADYEKAINDKLTLGNKLKELKSELKEAAAKKYEAKQLATEDHLVEGEQYKLQLEFAPTIYLNGKKLK